MRKPALTRAWVRRLPWVAVALVALVSGGEPGDRRVRQAAQADEAAAADLRSRSRGPLPDSNPGLVQDCETLLALRDALAGGAELDWSRTGRSLNGLAWCLADRRCGSTDCGWCGWLDGWRDPSRPQRAARAARAGPLWQPADRADPASGAWLEVRGSN